MKNANINRITKEESILIRELATWCSLAANPVNEEQKICAQRGMLHCMKLLHFRPILTDRYMRMGVDDIERYLRRKLVDNRAANRRYNSKNKDHE